MAEGNPGGKRANDNRRRDARVDTIDIDEIERRFPWVYERNRDCIISPDSDGIMCGLLMNHILGWRIRGFYDTKILVCDNQVRPSDCVFLDIEICRPGVLSIGQHFLVYDKRREWDHISDGLENCICPNLFREAPSGEVPKEINVFSHKYPFATIYILLMLLGRKLPDRIAICESAIPPLFFTDGCLQNSFSYKENASDWLRYLRVHEEWNPLRELFVARSFSITRLLDMMVAFFRWRDGLAFEGERGDRIALSVRGGNGTLVNATTHASGLCSFDAAPLQRAKRLLTELGAQTGWAFRAQDWCFDNWRCKQFKKCALAKLAKKPVGAIEAVDVVDGAVDHDDPVDEVEDTLGVGSFKRLMLERSPLSWAMTANDRLEFTVETETAQFFDP